MENKKRAFGVFDIVCSASLKMW